MMLFLAELRRLKVPFWMGMALVDGGVIIGILTVLIGQDLF